jgi:hypothetical protein
MTVTTITEFIEYLKTLPPDTDVRVLREYTIGYDTGTEYVPLEIGVNTDFIDLTGNPHVKVDNPLYNKKFLDIGGN